MKNMCTIASIAGSQDCWLFIIYDIYIYVFIRSQARTTRRYIHRDDWVGILSPLQEFELSFYMYDDICCDEFHLKTMAKFHR